MRQPVDGWFKLLSQEEGDFYAVPVTSEEFLAMKTIPKVRDRSGCAAEGNPTDLN